MKTMTCRQLGGACDLEFHADNFEEISEQSKKHGIQMFGAGDRDHIDAMAEMKKLMEDPKQMQSWLESKQKEFDELPDD